MSVPEEGLGLGWVAIVFSGFAVGYILSRIKWLSDRNTTTFCTWASAVFAGAIAFGDGLGDASLITIGGKIALFALIWLVFGLIFTLGVAMGIEKAAESKREKTRQTRE